MARGQRGDKHQILMTGINMRTGHWFLQRKPLLWNIQSRNQAEVCLIDSEKRDNENSIYGKFIQEV